MRTTWMLGTVVALGACAPRWEPLASSTDLQRDQDLYACMTEHTYDRSSATAGHGKFAASRGMEVQQQLVNQCMKAQGYQRQGLGLGPEGLAPPPSSWVASVAGGALSSYQERYPVLSPSATVGLDRNLGSLLSVGGRVGYRGDGYGTLVAATRLPPLPAVGLTGEVGAQTFHRGGVLPIARSALFVDFARQRAHSARASCGLELPLASDRLDWAPITGGCELGWRVALGG